jgi:SAM-dependent methyltransferase
MSDPSSLVRFYDEAYSRTPAQASFYARWRALSAEGKADHVMELCARAGIWAGGNPINTLEVGCGDGALLSELHRRGFGGRLAGVEITQAAVSIARDRPELDAISLYDGESLPFAESEYDLGILCHVLEHVEDPPALLAEVARCCKAVLVEVPLEANLSARRGAKRDHAAEVGHLHRLDRGAARAIIGEAGLSAAYELEDPLPLEVQRFFAVSSSERARATVKWSVRSGLHRLAPSAARRLFTVHYACLCLPGG